MAFAIRPLTADDDLEAFGRLVVESYEALPGQPAHPGYRDELRDVATRVEQAVVLGALEGSTPLGCVTYVEDEHSPHAEGLRPGESTFRMLAVDPTAQGHGVGEALVRACLGRATAAGRSAVFIYTGSWMLAAQRLYRRLGFVAVPDRDWEIPAYATLLGYWRGLPGPGEG